MSLKKVISLKQTEKKQHQNGLDPKALSDLLDKADKVKKDCEAIFFKLSPLKNSPNRKSKTPSSPEKDKTEGMYQDERNKCRDALLNMISCGEELMSQHLYDEAQLIFKTAYDGANTYNRKQIMKMRISLHLGYCFVHLGQNKLGREHLESAKTFFEKYEKENPKWDQQRCLVNMRLSQSYLIQTEKEGNDLTCLKNAEVYYDKALSYNNKDSELETAQLHLIKLQMRWLKGEKSDAKQEANRLYEKLREDQFFHPLLIDVLTLLIRWSDDANSLAVFRDHLYKVQTILFGKDDIRSKTTYLCLENNLETGATLSERDAFYNYVDTCVQETECQKQSEEACRYYYELSNAFYQRAKLAISEQKNRSEAIRSWLSSALKYSQIAKNHIKNTIELDIDNLAKKSRLLLQEDSVNEHTEDITDTETDCSDTTERLKEALMELSDYSSLIGSVDNWEYKVLTVAEFKKLPEKGQIEPWRIRFSQEGVESKFKDERKLDELVTSLVDNPTLQISPIEMIVKDGKVYSLDNRRLLAYQKAWSQNNKIKVSYIKKAESGNKLKNIDAKPGNGLVVAVRRNGKDSESYLHCNPVFEEKLQRKMKWLHEPFPSQRDDSSNSNGIKHDAARAEVIYRFLLKKAKEGSATAKKYMTLVRQTRKESGEKAAHLFLCQFKH